MEKKCSHEYICKKKKLKYETNVQTMNKRKRKPEIYLLFE